MLTQCTNVLWSLALSAACRFVNWAEFWNQHAHEVAVSELHHWKLIFRVCSSSLEWAVPPRILCPGNGTWDCSLGCHGACSCWLAHCFSAFSVKRSKRKIILLNINSIVSPYSKANLGLLYLYLVLSYVIHQNLLFSTAKLFENGRLSHRTIWIITPTLPLAKWVPKEL